MDMRGGGSGRLAMEGSGRGEVEVEVEEPYERGSWEEVDGGVRDGGEVLRRREPTHRR